MHLPKDFLFSQGSLQDFVDCQRRFQLRYLLRRAWPAVESQPVLESERFRRQGEIFHRMIQQHLIGLPAERLERLIHDEDLHCWWQNYQIFAQDPAGGLGALRKIPLEEQRKILYPELSLSAGLGGSRLMARFDLVVAMPGGRFVIYDWKTSRKRPKEQWLRARLQTRLYPYLLTQAGARLNAGRPVRPEQVEMIYWFAGFPHQPVCFQYSEDQCAADEAYLLDLIAQVRTLQEDQFYMTPVVERSKFCVYRSLCGRGVQAGVWDEGEDGLEPAGAPQFTLDFDQVGEVAF